MDACISLSFLSFFWVNSGEGGGLHIPVSDTRVLLRGPVSISYFLFFWFLFFWSWGGGEGGRGGRLLKGRKGEYFRLLINQ